MGRDSQASLPTCKGDRFTIILLMCWLTFAMVLRQGCGIYTLVRDTNGHHFWDYPFTYFMCAFLLGVVLQVRFF